MKKLIVMGIIAMMITGLSVAASANVGTVLVVEPVFDGGSFQPVFMGWYTDKGDGAASADGYDISDMGTDQLAMSGQMRFDLGAIAGIPGGFGTTKGDFKAPNLIGQTTQDTAKRWLVTASIANNPEHIGGTFQLKANFTEGFGPVGADFYIFAGAVSTANCKAYATAGTNYLAKLTMDNQSFNSGNFTLAAPTSSSSFDPITEEEVITWGANPVQYFTVYAQGAPIASVPEPGSMLAMFSGLVGLVGFGIRRRK